MNLSKWHWPLAIGTGVLMLAQMRDQILYFNDAVMGVAWIIAIASGWSVLPVLLVYGNNLMRVIAVVCAVGLFYWGDMTSVRASKAAKAERKLEQISEQELGVIGRSLRDQITIARNAKVRLDNRGVTSGIEYENARRDHDKAVREFQDHITSGQTEKSAAADAIADDNESVKSVAKKESSLVAWSMEGMSIVLMMFWSLYGVVSGRIELDFIGESTPAKKPQRSSQPHPKGHPFSGEKDRMSAREQDAFVASEKTEIEEMYLDTRKTAPPAKQADTRSTPPPIGADSVVYRLKGRSDTPTLIAAKKAMADIGEGSLMKSNGKPVTDKLSQKDLAKYSTSSKSQAAIMKHLADMGVVSLPGGKRAAIIAEEYRIKTPAKSDDKNVVTDAASALNNLGYTKPKSQAMAEQATGADVPSRILSALQIQGSH